MTRAITAPSASAANTDFSGWLRTVVHGVVGALSLPGRMNVSATRRRSLNQPGRRFLCKLR